MKLQPAYVAGFLDGDGYISLEKTRDWRVPVVSFSNADREILDQIMDVYGGKIYTHVRQNEKWSLGHNLKMVGGTALKLLEDVQPYLLHSKKKERCALILRDYKRLTPRNGKYTEQQKKEKRIFENEVMSIQMRGAGAYE